MANIDDELIIRSMSKRELAIRRRVHKLAEFYQHLFIYALVIGALWVVNLWGMWDGVLPTKWLAYWAIWPTMGWGIGVAIHALSMLPMWDFFSEDWEDRQVRELLARDAAQATKADQFSLVNRAAK